MTRFVAGESSAITSRRPRCHLALVSMTRSRLGHQKGFAILPFAAFTGRFVDQARSHADCCFQVFLQVLPSRSTDDWLAETKKYRDEYSQLRQKFTVNPTVEGTDKDLKLNNPLSTAKNVHAC